MQFLSMGYHACVLRYSVAPNRYPVALRELALTVAEIRRHAAGWHVDPDQILICGFSAGGHLACCLGEFWNQAWLYDELGKDPQLIRPNGLILCYPVISSGEFGHQRSFRCLIGESPDPEKMELLSLEKQVTFDMPDTFLWHTYEDQTVPVENSLMLALAMKKANVNFELHVYPHGGHGLALANRETGGNLLYRQESCCQSWISLVKCWIEHLNVRSTKMKSNEMKKNGGQTLV